MTGLKMKALALLILLFPLNNLAWGQTGSPLPARIDVSGTTFVLIPEGWFWYTVPNAHRFQELPQGVAAFRTHRIWLDSFYMAEHEATAADLVQFLNHADTPAAQRQEVLDEWTELNAAEIASNDGCTVTFSADEGFSVKHPGKRLPATFLSWNTASALTSFKGFRLPTEAEWQKAARGADKRIWPWGDVYPDDTFGRMELGRDCHPAAVDSHPKGRSPYGIYHMAGNAAEYVQDWYNHSFDQSIEDGMRNPVIAAEATPTRQGHWQKIVKGSSWSRDAIGHAIPRRSVRVVDSANNRNGVRFALDTRRVELLFEQGIAKPLNQDEEPINGS